VIGNWHEGQTLGLGYIALAALILSNWNPRRLMFFAWLFGFAQAIPLRLNDAPIINLLPPQFINMIPYVVTIVAIAGFVGKVRPPAAAGRAYEGPPVPRCGGEASALARRAKFDQAATVAAGTDAGER